MSIKPTLKANGVEPEFLMVSVCSTSTVKGPGEMSAAAGEGAHQIDPKLTLEIQLERLDIDRHDERVACSVATSNGG